MIKIKEFGNSINFSSIYAHNIFLIKIRFNSYFCDYDTLLLIGIAIVSNP